MRIVKFEPDRDLSRLEAYLADRYWESRRAVSWLPERLHDLLYRLGMQEALSERGYRKYPEEEYLSCAYPAEKAPTLPKGFRLLYGEDYPDEENKWSALRLSFHPDWEGPDYTASMAPYHGRKHSSLFRDSFECLIMDE